MKIQKILVGFLLLWTFFIQAQTNEIKIDASLDIENYALHIQQQIIFNNNSEKPLDTIFLHNWMNGYRDNETPLAKRLIEDYNKTLYFAKDKHRGETTIKNISIDFQSINFIEYNGIADIIAIPLNETIQPRGSTQLNLTYTVRIPSDKYTSYGRNREFFNLRYWYLVPANYTDKWELMSNLNMDDLYMDIADYDIKIAVPKFYRLSSSLIGTTETNNNDRIYHLKGKKRVDIELSISPIVDYTNYETDNVIIESNMKSVNLDLNVRRDILGREMAFLEEQLGKYPHKKLFVDRIAYLKNPVYGLNQLPSFIQPFSDAFEWDIKMFKILSKTYIDNTLLINRREDMWLADGIQHYLMMKYVETYYPEIKAIGNISKVWGIRTFNLAKLDFNDKYPFVYQFAARKNVDQALSKSADSLSNFNRKLVNKYKAGLGLEYLDAYIGKDLISENIKEFYNENVLKNSSSKSFKNNLINSTGKDLSWFFGDYVQSKKKIDYTIKKINVVGDSIDVVIKNKRNITVPVMLYGVNNNEIKYKKWYSNIDSTATVRIPKDSIDRLALNYEFKYPELNLRDNWKSVKKRLFDRPVKFKLFKDIENPYYNQIFYDAKGKYNYYDGLQIGLNFSNKSLLNKPFSYRLQPFYGIKSQSLTGSFSLLYEYTPEETVIDRLQLGFAGSYFHYDTDLSYQTFSPYAVLNFKRKSLRDVGGSALIASLSAIQRDIDPNEIAPNPEEYKYNIFSLSYVYSKPALIEDFRHATNLEFESDFTKLSYDLRYRRLTDNLRQFDFRLFAGVFLRNKTESDFFSYGLSKQNDYLFRLNFFGRSEESGFFSQQYITSEGGFKSHVEKNFANQWMVSFNSSIGLWRWIEVYNDVALLKSKNESTFFAYENGIRLNFVHEILEVYFPVYSNNGWEITQEAYPTRIRFVLSINPKKIINFARRGFF
ncbi:MAG: aminopeptidase [Bacteroidetes bacterium MedPE-SWsnd-G1]|nr:MAG: aminopeptidase [Bacteroidetes bacterium MedPE-SWsnd-G1]